TVRKPVMIARETAAAAPDETPVSADRYLEQFPLVLPSDQRSMFNRLTSREAKERFYDSYWASTPGREDFEERVTGAERYSTQFTEGWRTDRGRVFIIYGPPDEVESVPFQVDGFPYEIWYYYQAGNQYFVFVDRNANGSYMQIYSTIEGEVSYPNWEQMLRPIRVPTMDDGGLSDGSAPSERIEVGCLFSSGCRNAVGPDPRHGVPAAAPACRWS
ncbi:GWxTD domain-containing protein, partial [Candidatus Fermentibacteria bacterium]|nr:GWxTD domain-containing protein [Candidatus Fermentibacteria bacterium]